MIKLIFHLSHLPPGGLSPASFAFSQKEYNCNNNSLLPSSQAKYKVEKNRNPFLSIPCYIKNTRTRTHACAHNKQLSPLPHSSSRREQTHTHTRHKTKESVALADGGEVLLDGLLREQPEHAVVGGHHANLHLARLDIRTIGRINSFFKSVCVWKKPQL